MSAEVADRRARRATRVLGSTLVAMLAVLALAACGVPGQEQAQVAKRKEVPFGLLDPTDTSIVPSQSVTSNVVIYLVTTDRQHLLAVARDVGATDPVAAAVAALAAGPTDREAAFGLQTALPAQHLVRSVKVTEGVAAVDLDTAFGDIGGSNQLLAIAQIVYTLTAQPGVSRVTFSVDGGAVEIPRGDGSLTSGAVSRADYQQLAPSP